MLAAFLFTGCSEDEKIVFRDRDLFNAPPDEVHGFLGYYKPEEKLTPCGNCHVGMQAEWETTAHADAYATLEASGHASASCYGCHTVSDMGTHLAVAGGWNAVQSEAYHDEQCESCHGAGHEHVQNPDLDAAQPVPSLAVSPTFETGCAECHSGNHHPFAEEWSQSAHANVVSSAAGRAECASCHRGQDALEAWGAHGNYLEKDSAEHLPITCGVCHDPHETRYEGQLRFPINTNSIELHLCARCHNRRTQPDLASSHGLSPHAPEAALMLGDAGWFPPGGEIDQGQIIASHGSEGNERLCASCHVNRFEVTDAETGAFVFQATGHLFNALPCVDSQGIPVPGDCDYNTTDRSFLACATTGCHLSTTAASSALTLATLSIENYANDLMDALLIVDPNLEGAGGEIDTSNPIFTVAEGSLFNYNLATFGSEDGEPINVTSAAAHNPFLTGALLLASLNAVEDEYGVTPRSRTDYRAELDRWMERARK
jgi:predicted CXXCH cytochrome family protein